MQFFLKMFFVLNNILIFRYAESEVFMTYKTYKIKILVSESVIYTQIQVPIFELQKLIFKYIGMHLYSYSQ